MSSTARSSARSTVSGRIKTENPALAKILTSDSLTDTRLVDAEHKSPVHKPHASTNASPVKTLDNRPSSRYSDNINIDNNRPESRYSDKTSDQNRPNSRYSEKGEEIPNRGISDENRPSSRYSVKSDTKPNKEESTDSSWGNVDESLTFDINNINKPEQTIDNPSYSAKSRENTLERFSNRVPTSNSLKSLQNSEKKSPSKIDLIQVQRAESPSYDRTRSRELNTPSGVSYSSSRLKNQGISKEHPKYLEARSASQLIDAHGGGIEADSLDIDSGLVADTTSYLETAPDSGRQTYRVPTPITDNVPVIHSASSRFRSDSRTSQRSLSANSATGVAYPQIDRNASIVSDNGIPPPSNLNLSGGNHFPKTEENNSDQDSLSKRTDPRKSAVSFKEPVISDYHSHTEGRDTGDWDTPRDRNITPQAETSHNFQDSLDFEGGRISNFSPEPTRPSDTDIPSALYSESVTAAERNNSSKSGRSVKKVYIDSPTFTKEEEDEYRFVESRLDEMNEDLEDTVRRIEEQGDKYRQEREAMNEEAARLRAEIQATEGYSNSYNRNLDDRYSQGDNYSDNRGRPIAHPTDEMDARSYERPQDQYQNGYGNSQGYNNLRDSREVHNTRNDRYEDRDDPRNLGNSYSQNQDSYSRSQRGQNRESEDYTRDQGGYARDNDTYQQDRYDRGQDNQYARRQEDQYRGQQDDRYRGQQDDRYRGQQDDQYRGQQDDGYKGQQDDGRNQRQNDQYYDRRGDSPTRYGVNIERGDDDLRRETEYQEDLRHRIQSNQQHDSEIVIPHLPPEDQFRDSLDENGYGTQRNYPEQEGYGNWGNPPPNPFGQGRGENEQYLNKPDEKQNYEEDKETARMEILHPQEPKVDYVEENKFTYGLPPSKNYKTIKQKEKEAEQKLTEIFVHPKKAGGKKHKRTIPMPNEDRRPPLTELKGNDVGAEGVWAKRSAQLAKHKDNKTTTSGTVKKSRGLQKFPSDSGINSNQGQIYQGEGRMYGTPTRNQYLEPIGYKPQVSKDEPHQSPAFREGSYKKPMELAPIKTEIVTDDGQKISVDINLKVLSPTLQRRIKSHPDDYPESGLPFNVHADVQQKRGTEERRPVGVQYQPANRGNGDNFENPSRSSPRSQGSRQYPVEDNRSYQDQPPPPNQAHQESYRGNSYESMDDEALRKQEEALMAELNLSPNPYSKIPPIPIRDELTVPMVIEKGGYAAMYNESKHKDPNSEPWYQVYTVKDFKRMQKEVRLNRGLLGPDLDNETYKEKLEKRHKQFEYARMVMERNKMELHEKKPTTSRKDPTTEEQEKSKRKATENSTRKALDYAKNVPKPAVKPRPNQYNSYEVASQLSPIAKSGSVGSMGSKSPTHGQNLEAIDLKKLQQRHEQEKKNVAMLRQNMESVPQKA